MKMQKKLFGPNLPVVFFTEPGSLCSDIFQTLLCRLGLSVQESKELSLPNLDQKFQEEKPEDSSRTQTADAAAVSSNPLKAKCKLMKTRGSEHAEEPKCAAPPSEPGPLDSSEVWKPAEQSSPRKLPIKEHEEESNDTEAALQTGSDLQEHLGEETPAAHGQELTPSPSSPSPSLKRRSVSEADDEMRAEKMSRLSSASSASSASPSASSSPATPSPTNQRVPPLKVGGLRGASAVGVPTERSYERMNRRNVRKQICCLFSIAPARLDPHGF